MNGLIFAVVAVFLVPNIFARLCRPDLGKVIFTNILYRHGDRTPWRSYPNDPYRDESMWPLPFGELTNLGKEQHLALGRWLRRRYKDLLSETYLRSEIHVQSTDIDRALMSAAANLAGLYPPKGGQIWSDVNWMPIPIHTISKDEDYLYAKFQGCPRAVKKNRQAFNGTRAMALVRENQDMFDLVTEKSGMKVDTISLLYVLYDILQVEDMFNLTLPAWTRSVYPERMKNLAEMYFEFAFGTDALKRLTYGRVLGEMVHNMKQKADNSLSPDRKMWMYSAHDMTVAWLLLTLGVFDRHFPPYAATVMLELRETEEHEHVVTVFYKNSTAEPLPLTIRGCSVACPLDKFVELMEPFIPIDREQECEL